MPEETIDIDIRVWIANTISNTEMNKSFFAKIKVEGSAIQKKNIKYDNSNLINPLIESTESKDSQDPSQQSDNTEIEQLPQ